MNSINYENIVNQLEESGLLDGDGAVDSVLALHEVITDAGLPADDPTTYRILIMALALLSQIANEDDMDMPSAIEWVGRTSVRSLRDLTHGQG